MIPASSRKEDDEDGGLNCSVYIATDLLDYDDVGTSREIERQAKMNNKMDEKELKAKAANLVLAGSTTGQLDQKQVQAALASTDGVLLPDLSRLQKSPRASAASSAMEDDAEEDDMEVEADTGGGKGEKEKDRSGGRQKWFDAVAQQAKVSRQFDSHMQKTKAKIAAMLAQMQEALDSARASPNATKAKTEMMILDNRKKALDVIYQGTAADFTKYVSEVHSNGRDRSGAEGSASARSAADQQLSTLVQP